MSAFACSGEGGNAVVVPSGDGEDLRANDNLPEGTGDGIDDLGNGDSGDPTPGDTPVCGNGVREGDEECDGRDMLADACAMYGWTGTADLVCNEHCLLDAPFCETGSCGNGQVDAGEDCDGGPSRTSLGCTLDCRSLGSGEVEPNDTMGQATPLDAVLNRESRITGSLVPADVDYYRIHVDAATELIASTSDGRDGCDLDTVLTLYDADGTELARNDDGPNYPCSTLGDGETAAALGGAGDYYLVVTGFFDDQSGPYTLHVSLLEPVCGDGRLSAGEECDDAGQQPDDGCDADCRFEAADEVEPNDSIDQPDGPHNPTPTTPVLVRGALADASDVDVFAVPMGLGDSFTRIDVIPAGPTCTFDATVELLDPQGVVLASDSYGDGYACATLTGSWETGITDLQEGTHYVRVSSDYGETGTYLLNLVVRRAECGNGEREGAEMCDDANADATDGCDACVLDADPEVEPNDSVSQFSDLGSFTTSGATAVAGSIDSAADVDVFGIEVADGARLEIWNDDGGTGCEFDTVIEFLSATGDAIVSDDDGGVSPCSRLDKNDPEMIGLDAGSYRILVRPFSEYSEGGFYVLHVVVRYPTCGDGIVEGAEICDDDNLEIDDGCSDACLPEGQTEVESNDTPEAVATPIDLTSGEEILVVGSISPAGDVDFVRVSVAQGAQVGARLWRGSPGCAVDSRVSLRSDADTVVRTGVALESDLGCWQVGGVEDAWAAETGLDAGEYFLRVAGRNGDTGAYQLILWAD